MDEPSSRATDQPKYGLVLSGGGLKIATHCGVVSEIAQWADEGQSWVDKFQVLVGTSAGALYSAFLAAGYTPTQFIPCLFVRPELKQALCDWNWQGAPASFLKRRLGYFRGLAGGAGAETLFDTALSRQVRDVLVEADPTDQSDQSEV